MIYRGHVRNGVVVLEDSVDLPEGAEVRVEIVKPPAGEPSSARQQPTLGQKLLKYAGKAVGLPCDAARNHDHYLYGARKR